MLLKETGKCIGDKNMKQNAGSKTACESDGRSIPPFCVAQKKNRLAYLCALAFCWALLLASPKAVASIIVERIAAVVNGQIILLSDVNSRLRPYMQRLMKIEDPNARRQARKRLQNEQLQRLIEEKLILGEANRRKIQISEAEVNRAIKSVMDENNVDYNGLKAALKAQGYSMSQYKQDLKQQILRLKVLNMAVRSRISVSVDDVKAFYQKQKRRLGVETKIEAQLIMLRLPQSGPHRRSKLRIAYSKIKTIKKKLADKAASFASLAENYSDHPSASKGGLVGYIGQGDLPPALEKIVFSAQTKKGQIIGPVETDEGIYLLKIGDKQDSEALPFNEVKNKLRKQIFQKRLEKETQQWLDQLRRKAYIDIKL